MKIAYQNGGFTIWYKRGSTPQKRNKYSNEVQRVDNVFYVETKGKWRYTKEDAIRMCEFLLLNMVYYGEREKFKEMLRKRLGL